MSRTQKDFAPRKEKLIQIALDQFLEKGYENTTISDLQKAFGLTIPQRLSWHIRIEQHKVNYCFCLKAKQRRL